MLTFSPFKQVVSIAPRWQGGYNYRLNKRFLIGAELGISFSNLNISPLLKEMNHGGEVRDYQSIEIAPELYFQLNPDSKKILMFVSGGSFFRFITNRT